MYRVNFLRFFYKKKNISLTKKKYIKILSDLNKRLKLRYKVSVDIKKICEYLKKENIKPTYGKLYDIVMSHLYIKDTAKHWAEKNQLLWREIPDFLEIMPNGKAIVVVRDPRSVLASFKKYTYAKPPLYLQAIFNCFDLFNFIKTNNKLIKNKKLYVVKYEKVALRPKHEINKVFKFLNLRTLNEVKIKKNQLDAYGNIWENNTSYDKNKSPKKFAIDASIDRWKKNLSAEEVLLTETICSDHMKDFKYKCKFKTSDTKIFKKSLELFMNDKEIKDCFNLFINKGVGIQKFPTDPLQKKNWSKP